MSGDGQNNVSEVDGDYKVKHIGCVVTLFFIVGILNIPSSKDDQVFVFICTQFSSIF